MITHENITDLEVIARILKGEIGLYEQIVRRYNPVLYKVGRTYNYNHQDTEDLMQDTFIDAYKNLKGFQGRASFKTWIIRIMMNNCYQKRRQSNFKYEISKELDDYSKPMFKNSKNNTDRMVHNDELKHIIENALSRIPFKYRIVFSLREINELNVAETAELLNISESNVKVRLNRAKRKLRKEIEKEYSPSELYEFNLIYCDAIVNNVMKKIHEIR